VRSFVRRRIEPEVVFKLKRPVPATYDPLMVLDCVEWLAARFEIVQCHFLGWDFTPLTARSRRTQGDLVL
jgi:2-keto-4-pentenoate hydratase